MLMTTLVILQFIKIFLVYTGITVVLPRVMFQSVLKGRKYSEQFLMSYTFGNFYIINIVFVLQLLHISNLFTLTFVTGSLSFFIWVKVNHIPFADKLKTAGEFNRMLIQETIGTKQALYRFCLKIRFGLKKIIYYFYRRISSNAVEVFFFMLILYCLFWVYGRQMIISYGYHASDIPVHMSWINQLGRGNLFSAGVYPFGYHCMIYYLHIVFGIDTYTLMFRFAFVQVIYVHIVLFAALKLMCRSKYMPYAGTLVYILGGFFAYQTYFRYASALPQEYGMIFVIPSIYFLIRFFQTQKKDLKTKETKRILQCFAMAFSLTLAIHFYGTMIAGLCCVGIAIGFCTRFVRKDYFVKIMLTGIISVFLAVLPMGIAHATGTPLQGSLGWGMKVMSQSSSEDDSENESTGIQNTEESAKKEEQKEKEQKPLMQRVTEAVQYNLFSDADGYESFYEKGPYVVYLIIGALIVFGLLHCILKRREYGMQLLSIGFCMGLMLMLLVCKQLGLPTLMDAMRSSIYFAYLLPIAATLFIDGVLYFIFMIDKLYFLRSLVSFVIMIGTSGFLFTHHLLKRIDFESIYIRNGAVICLTNIIHENKDYMWTIVSANDEMQMGLDHGWHYETIEFLEKMEHWKETTKMNLPTQKVYFFIEKIPVDYYYTVSEDSGRSISKKYASLPLPKNEGNSMYQGDNRRIVMSKLYYWADAFKTKYPNEMKVYYESDEFICYEISQNVYHKYNFAIDYAFNQVQEVEN